MLGPILFSLYINDVDCVISPSSSIISKVLFADDTKLFRPVASLTDSIGLQADINNFVTWCDLWKLKINKKTALLQISSMSVKSSAFTYFIKSTPIQQASS
jgi:hypothetical protein